MVVRARVVTKNESVKFCFIFFFFFFFTNPTRYKMNVNFTNSKLTFYFSLQKLNRIKLAMKVKWTQKWLHPLPWNPLLRRNPPSNPTVLNVIVMKWLGKSWIKKKLNQDKTNSLIKIRSKFQLLQNPDIPSAIFDRP